MSTAPANVNVDAIRVKYQPRKYRDKDILVRLLNLLGPYRARFVGALLASLPASAIDGATAWFIGPFVDKMLKGGNYSFLLWVPLVIILASVAQGVFQYISTYYTNYVGLSITRDVGNQLFGRLLRMDLNYFKNSTTGDLLARYNADPSRLQTAIIQNCQEFIVQFFTAIFLAAVLFYRNWLYALVSIAIISLIVIPVNIIAKKVRRLDFTTMETTSRLLTIFHDSIQGIRVVKVFQLYAYQFKLFEKAMAECISTTMRVNKANIILKPILQVIGAVGMAIILTFGSLEVKNHHMTPGDLASFLLALILLYKPVKALGSLLGKVQLILAPAERVFEKLDLMPDIDDPPNPVEVNHFESLVFDHVSFTYDGQKQVLRNINLEVAAGQTIALVGTSGGGKTTMVDMIPRFMDPTEGRILINGHDLKSARLADLRSLISIVTQDAILFEGTIHDNIILGKLNATEAEILEAAHSAYLMDWVETLPDGLNTAIGERGSRISGGQKQRIAIARAFLKNAPVLILDEATSALDNESEEKVQQALNNLLVGRTVFVIAHRLSTVQFADRILVMQHGQIIESGTHQELLAKDGAYARLYNIQFRYENDLKALEENLPAVALS